MISHQVYSDVLAPERVNYWKWAGPSINSTDCSHFELKVWCSSIARFWSYSLPKLTFGHSCDYKEGDVALHSAAPLRSQSGCDDESMALGSHSMVAGLPNYKETSPKVASRRKHGTGSDNTYIRPIILVAEF